MDEVSGTIGIGPKKGLLLNQCLPISYLKLLDGYVLVIAEGPCLLITHPKKQFSENYKRFQLFPNQLTITGISFVEDSCGYPSRTASGGWNGRSEDHSVAFVWAGNHGLFITINRTTCDISKITTESYAFGYIPIAARWFNDGRTLALLSVFNYVVIYERDCADSGTRELTEVAKYECERENLYSGTMDGDDVDKLLVFSGTTFKGILVWEIQDGQVVIRFKLTGHQGIPFSLEYDSELRILLSASDDRTVLAWSFTDKEVDGIIKLPVEVGDKVISGSNLQSLYNNNGKQGEGTLPTFAIVTHMIRGHEARVWKAIWVSHAGFLFIVSVGEDSCIQMTSYDRTVTKSWRTHDGASIYHCAYDQLNDLLYTAAQDGSVFKWKRFYLKTSPTLLSYDKIPSHPWTNDLNAVNAHGRALINKDYPRNVCLWDTNYIIASMDSGRLISFCCSNQLQSNIFYDERLKRYGVLSVSCQRSLLAVGGVNGDFILLKTYLEDNPYSQTKLVAEKLWTHKFETKIINIHWLTDDTCNQTVIVCLGKAYLFRFLYGNEEKTEIVGECLQTFPLQLERPGLPTVIMFPTSHATYIIGGDEVGTISVFQVSKMENALVYQKKNIHHEGVTSIVEYKSRIMTAGRYGGIKLFSFEEDSKGIQLLQQYEFHPPFVWVGKLLPILIDDDLLIGGFQKGNFIIYSWKEKRVLNEIMNLGGGHRRWDFKFGGGNAALTYLRDRELYFSTTSIIDRLNTVLKPGLHSKTINCGITLQMKRDNLYIATGSEDGTIRVLRYEVVDRKFNPIHRINCHASSVRTLASLNIDEDHVLLFSGGGRSEIFAFLVGIGDVEELTMMGKITVIKAKNRDTEIDTRVMDVSVMMIQGDNSEQNIYCCCACSDGIVRILSFCKDSKKFTIVNVLHGNGHAVLRLQSLIRQDFVLVFGVTSNGFLLSWKWTWKNENDQSTSPTKFTRGPQISLPSYSKQLRLAAIMSMKIFPSDSHQNNFILAIGSDDCSVSTWTIKLNGSVSEVDQIQIDMEPLWSENQAQRGAVTGIDVCDNVIYSCSNDQIVAKWDLNGALLGEAFAGVSDCQGFIVSLEYDCITCFGDGLTWISCP